MRPAALAALLYLGGLGLPLGGWFSAGRSEARRNEQALVAQARAEADEAVKGAAARLWARLEALRLGEEKRPYYHYQNLFHDPNGASAGPSVVPSPLAQGPSDPLVEAYFQLDEQGRVTLPTLNDEVPASSAEGAALENQRGARQQLQLGAARIAQAPGPSPRALARGDAQALAPQAAASAGEPRLSPKSAALTKDSIDLGNEMKIGADSYAQNLQATRIYLDIKSAKKPSYQLPEGRQNSINIATGALRWHLVPLGGRTRVMGLRQASTPDGALLQGFLVSDQAMLDAAAAPRVRLLPEAPRSPDEASAPVGSSGLWAALDRAGEESTARAAALAEWRQFLGLFSLAALVVAAAGALVVLVVARADRLAGERSRFAASAAHELRTPLAGLRMYAEMLAEGLGDPAKHGDYARRVALEAERLGRVVGNVLGFTRLERNALVVKPRPGDLAAFVEESCLKLLPWAEAMGIALDLSIEATPAVDFDPDAVVQVLQNLIDNSEKYGRTSADRAVLVATRAHEGGAEFAVIDHGPGVPEKLRRRLFSPFARSTDPDDPPGLGLGLSLARALVVAHGGLLTHEPSPGGGATFRAWFPPPLR